MDNNRLSNIHPNEILRLEFLKPMNITAYRLSKDIGVSQTRISEIFAETRSITADTALRLSSYFGNIAVNTLVRTFVVVCSARHHKRLTN
jgi:antitoxin HigA-1